MDKEDETTGSFWYNIFDAGLKFIQDVMKEDEKEFEPSKAYATQKTIAQGALDLALLSANASQLKALIDIPSNNRTDFYVGLLVLLSISITLQVVVAIVLLFVGLKNHKFGKENRRTEILNEISVVIILLITIVNVFISAIGIHIDSTRP